MNLGEEKIGVLFIKYLFPTLVGMFFASVFTVSDGMIVGRGVGAEGLAAVNIISPLFTLSSGWGLMFGTGGAVLAAQALGRNGKAEAGRFAALSLFWAGFSSAVISVVLVLFPKLTFTLLSVPPELESRAIEYLYPIAGAIFFNVLMDVGLFFIRLDGSPKYSMMCIATGAVLNILLDILFVFPLNMGLFGAALATLLTQIVAVGMMGYYIFKRAAFFSVKTIFGGFKLAQMNDRNIWKTVNIGFPALLGDISISLMTVVSNRVFFEYYGVDGIAAFSVVCFLLPILFMVYNAIIQSAQPIISYNLSLSKDRVYRCAKLAFWATLCMGIVLTVLTLFFNNQMVSVFLDGSTRAHTLASEGIVLFSSGLIFTGVNILAVGWLQSIGNGKLSTVLTILRGIVYMLFCMMVIPEIFGGKSIWLCIPCAELMCLVTLFFIRKRLRA